jgi:nitrogen fixation NifU-like protein
MYSEAATDHFHHPRHVGVLEDATVVGRQGTPGQGPHMVLYLRLEADRIADARFQTYGCPAAIACGSWLSEWVIGRTKEEALLLSASQVNEGLGGLPLGKEHCPPLAVGALRDAVFTKRDENEISSPSKTVQSD